MRWNQLADDVPRATALADILCAAVSADQRIDDAELVIAEAMLLKVLGGAMPDEVRDHLRGAVKKRSPDVGEAFTRLALTTDRDKKALLQVVTDIAQADGKITKAEQRLLERLGALLAPTA